MSDLIERIVKLSGRVGLNEVRIRWKLLRFQQSLQRMSDRADERAAHVRYEHKVCRDCGRLNDRDAVRCLGCDAGLGSKAGHVLERMGFAFPAGVSVSSLLALAIMLVYVRCVMAQGGGGFFSFEIRTLVAHGANVAPLVLAGQWWRVGTAIFLHVGLWHVMFNLFALMQVGPVVEQTFGRGPMILFYMVTGIAGNVARVVLSGYGAAAGASGALMGLVGVAAGWGHRDGTSIGRTVRDLMVKWALYTVVFGMFLGADNYGHIGGFLAGLAIGLVARPQRGSRSALAAPSAIAGGLLALLAVGLALFPPR